MNTEQRKYGRSKCEFDSFYKSLDPTTRPATAETVIQEISEGGIRFRANHFIPVHHKLLFRINIPNQRCIEAVAQPAWIREIPSLSQYDIGAKFLSLPEGDKEIIRQFVSNLPSSV